MKRKRTDRKFKYHRLNDYLSPPRGRHFCVARFPRSSSSFAFSVVLGLIGNGSPRLIRTPIIGRSILLGTDIQWILLRFVATRRDHQPYRCWVWHTKWYHFFQTNRFAPTIWKILIGGLLKFPITVLLFPITVLLFPIPLPLESGSRKLKESSKIFTKVTFRIYLNCGNLTIILDITDWRQWL